MFINNSSDSSRGISGIIITRPLDSAFLALSVFNGLEWLQGSVQVIL